MYSRESSAAAGQNGAAKEVEEGVIGAIAEAGAEGAAPKRWKHKVELWKHPKVGHSTICICLMFAHCPFLHCS